MPNELFHPHNQGQKYTTWSYAAVLNICVWFGRTEISAIENTGTNLKQWSGMAFCLWCQSIWWLLLKNTTLMSVTWDNPQNSEFYRELFSIEFEHHLFVFDVCTAAIQSTSNSCVKWKGATWPHIYLIYSRGNLRKVLANAGDREFGAVAAAHCGTFACFHRWAQCYYQQEGRSREEMHLWQWNMS